MPNRFILINTFSEILLHIRVNVRTTWKATTAIPEIHFVGTDLLTCRLKSIPYNLFSEQAFILLAASSEFGTYRLCEQRRLRRACASAQSHQNLRCSLIQAVSQEEPSDRMPDPWPFWMAGHAQLKFVITECSKTQICLTGLLQDADGCYKDGLTKRLTKSA